MRRINKRNGLGVALQAEDGARFQRKVRMITCSWLPGHYWGRHDTNVAQGGKLRVKDDSVLFERDWVGQHPAPGYSRRLASVDTGRLIDFPSQPKIERDGYTVIVSHVDVGMFRFSEDLDELFSDGKTAGKQVIDTVSGELRQADVFDDVVHLVDHLDGSFSIESSHTVRYEKLIDQNDLKGRPPALDPEEYPERAGLVEELLQADDAEYELLDIMAVQFPDAASVNAYVITSPSAALRDAFRSWVISGAPLKADASGVVEQIEVSSNLFNSVHIRMEDGRVCRQLIPRLADCAMLVEVGVNVVARDTVLAYGFKGQLENGNGLKQVLGDCYDWTLCRCVEQFIQRTDGAQVCLPLRLVGLAALNQRKGHTLVFDTDGFRGGWKKFWLRRPEGPATQMSMLSEFKLGSLPVESILMNGSKRDYVDGILPRPPRSFSGSRDKKGGKKHDKKQDKTQSVSA